MSDKRQSVGRRMSRTQSDAAPPEMQMVSVAVLPPRLPRGMAPPTGVAAAGVQSWDERINYDHNEPIDPSEGSKTKQFMRKAGFTTQRERLNKDLPPFTFRQVPYDTWRKHYAKDAEGNYRGTHAPAQDCLLKPDDVKKWRFAEEPQTQADKWTRGSEVLPVYAEVQQEGLVPEYKLDYTGPPDQEPTIERNASHAPSLTSNQPAHDLRTGDLIADGKTAQQIIEEAKAKQKPTTKTTWKNMFKRGAEMAVMGSG